MPLNYIKKIRTSHGDVKYVQKNFVLTVIKLSQLIAKTAYVVTNVLTGITLTALNYLIVNSNITVIIPLRNGSVVNAPTISVKNVTPVFTTSPKLNVVFAIFPITSHVPNSHKIAKMMMNLKNIGPV